MLEKELDKTDFGQNKNVGQTLSDNGENLIRNNSCVVGPEQKILRTLALFNCQVEPDLHTHHEVSPSSLVERRHPGRSLSGSTRRAEGFPRGFTLIELLVVVLIIGILAAVALPQYQKAVEKSKAAQMLSLFKAVAQAASVSYLAEGTFPNDFEQLDVELPAGWKEAQSDTKHYNGWYLTLVHDNQYGWRGVNLVAYTGKYAGTGFSYYVKSDGRDFPLNQILCREEQAVAPAGIFCEKVMGDTWVANVPTRFYKM